MNKKPGSGNKKTILLTAGAGAFFLLLITIVLLVLNTLGLNRKIIQLQEQSERSYSSYGKGASGAESSNADFEIYLPDRLYVASGITMELYNNQVTSLGTRITDYNVLWVCDIGKNMERKFSITANEEWIGEYPLECKVFDDNGNCLASAMATLCLVPNTIGGNFSLLTIGDSLSAEAATYEHLSQLTGNNIIYMGTLASGGCLNEARRGFSAYDYLHETAYQYEEGQPLQPFYNKEAKRFDWNYYKETTGFDPDVIEIFLGTNGSDVDPTENGNNIIQIINYIREDDPDIPIYVVNSIYPADQNGIGSWQNQQGYPLLPGRYKVEEDKKIFNLMVYLSENLADYDNLYLVPAALTHDSAYNFKNTTQSVNPYSSITESVPTDGFHPGDEGYCQIADTIFSTICGTMKDWKN